MKKLPTSKLLYYFIISAVAVVLSIGSFQSTTMSNQTACSAVGICETEQQRVVKGTETSTAWGFPANYKQTERFEPSDTTAYAEVSTDSQGFSPLMVAVNIVFWLLLIDFVARRFTGLVKTSKK